MNTPTTLRLLRRSVRESSSLINLTRLSTTSTVKPISAFRPLSTTASRLVTPTAPRQDPSDPYHKASTDATGTSAGPHEGSASRTDRDIVVEYPDDESALAAHELPLRGRGGVHYVRTLPTFSLEGRTAVVTGGARGLGLVMGQALVGSGADLAIVDLNSTFNPRFHPVGVHC